MKTAEQIGREVIEKNYGIGTEWEEPNAYGEEGFTRAQAEIDIDADDIRRLIEQGIEADRALRREQALSVLATDDAVDQILDGMGIDWTVYEPNRDQVAQALADMGLLVADSIKAHRGHPVFTSPGGWRARCGSPYEAYEQVVQAMDAGHTPDQMEWEA